MVCYVCNFWDSLNQSPACQGKRYLAVAPHLSTEYAPKSGLRMLRPNPACIQIWSFTPSGTSEDDVGTLSCDLVLCVDCGPAQEIRWCPLPSHDSVSSLLCVRSSSPMDPHSLEKNSLHRSWVFLLVHSPMGPCRYSLFRILRFCWRRVPACQSHCEVHPVIHRHFFSRVASPHAQPSGSVRDSRRRLLGDRLGKQRSYSCWLF